MKRALMQVYVKGSVEAVRLYQQAFDATLGYNVKNADGTYYHSELDADGQIIAVAESPRSGGKPVAGDTMQFCFEFGQDQQEAIRRAYDVLKEGAEIFVPLGPCEYSPAMTDLVDKFGVRWCLFL